MYRQSATVCLVKSPALDGVAELSLVERLRLLPDPRRHRGLRHPFVAVLLVAAAAVVAGARSYAAIGQWAANAPQHALVRLGARVAGGMGVRGRTECRHDPAGHRSGLPGRPGRSDRCRSGRLGLSGRGWQGRPGLPGTAPRTPPICRPQ
ncbi:transposase family protein [Streptomyces erythrochromogenes]|uniref:transposase family protein n=1 Tax=Streptomyces erythrochromogenes TaxID=285574 RepID=UPI00342E4C22